MVIEDELPRARPRASQPRASAPAVTSIAGADPGRRVARFGPSTRSTSEMGPIAALDTRATDE